MKNKRFTENQIFAILKEGESGVMIVPDLCRQYGVGNVLIISGNHNTVAWKHPI